MIYSYPRRRSDVKVQEMDGETVVLDQRLLQIHRLNTVATQVWMACDGRQSAENIAADIERRFRIDSETAARDVKLALESFIRAGLLEHQESAGRSQKKAR